MDGEMSDLDDGQAVAEECLQQGDDSADEEHGADDLRQVVGIAPHGWNDENGDQYLSRTQRLVVEDPPERPSKS